ncbi:unnamed protein product [Rotaria socialis]|uniref:Uncharacterized protein n=2 Tax=Rotaria socialis TaxID=392032 RepID=A0A820R040_9BILA|nr:unnamed protein product [Rotaria socialis]CAF4756687.1 unnamed protein product [Rotaria socialis]
MLQSFHFQQEPADERIEYMSANRYFEMKAGRQFLFRRWPPRISNDDTMNKKFKRSIEKFISPTLQSIITCCAPVQAMAFLTNEWENFGVEHQQQLANGLINIVKQELEIRKVDWQILFIFSGRQKHFYEEFYRIFIALQTDRDDKTIEKYQLMSEILKQKASLQIPPSVPSRTSSRASTRRNPIDLKADNIYFSYSQQDQPICSRITDCLINEGSSICETSSTASQFKSYIDIADVALVLSMKIIREINILMLNCIMQNPKEKN